MFVSVRSISTRSLSVKVYLLTLVLFLAFSPAAKAQSFCTGELIFDQPSTTGQGIASESTCGLCETDQLVRAENFSIERAMLITEIVIWGYYFDDRVPELEHWTVAFHTNDFIPNLPAGAFSVQNATPVSRVATGATSSTDGLVEYRWLLRLDEPVQLDINTPDYWLEIFHDSPDSDVIGLIGGVDFGSARSAASIASAPGSEWGSVDFGLAMQICGLDSRWNGLVVPRFELDTSNPADATLLAARNTTDGQIGLEVAYYGSGRIEDGPLRADRFVVEPRATRPININLDPTGLDPDEDGRAAGFIVVRELSFTEDVLGVANLTGDFSRVDFTNDFAAGERLVPPSAFCQTQEIRVVDFGSGSNFNIVLRDPPREANQVAFNVTIFNEAGVEVGRRSVFHRFHTRQLAIEELTSSLSFGTLVFDFSPSGSGVVTGSYSAFGRFSTEVLGACRD